MQVVLGPSFFLDVLFFSFKDQEDDVIATARPRRMSEINNAPTQIMPIPPASSFFIFSPTNRWATDHPIHSHSYWQSTFVILPRFQSYTKPIQAKPNQKPQKIIIRDRKKKIIFVFRNTLVKPALSAHPLLLLYSSSFQTSTACKFSP